MDTCASFLQADLRGIHWSTCAVSAQRQHATHQGPAAWPGLCSRGGQLGGGWGPVSGVHAMVLYQVCMPWSCIRCTCHGPVSGVHAMVLYQVCMPSASAVWDN